MGITIHFKGKIEDLNQVHPLIEELVDISKVMNWKYQIMDENWLEPSNAKLVHNKRGLKLVGHLGLKGISINLHPNSEQFAIYFNSNGNLTCPIHVVLVNEGKSTQEKASHSVKTQFAPPEVHIYIINLLKYLKKKYIPNLDVYDEGGYWDNGDKDQLIQRLDSINKAMDILENELNKLDTKLSGKKSSDELLKILEEIIKKKLN